MLDRSSLIFSTTGTQPSSDEFGFWPFLIIVIGLPFSPLLDQLFKGINGVCGFAVPPNLILFPNLPSYIISPANGSNGWILLCSLNVCWEGLIGLFKSISVDLSVTFLIEPAWVCW